MFISRTDNRDSSFIQSHSSANGLQWQTEESEREKSDILFQANRLLLHFRVDLVTIWMGYTDGKSAAAVVASLREKNSKQIIFLFKGNTTAVVCLS